MRTCIAIILFQIIVFAGMASASDDTTTYVIKKGDTLWGLSEQFLKNPRYWPDLWSKNAQITNPHLIYPGQKIRFVDGKPEVVQDTGASAQKAAEAAPAAVEQPEVAQEKTFTVLGNEGGLLEKELEPSGMIIAGQHGRVLIGEEDTVFTNIGADRKGVEGQKYTILRASGLIKHPVTNDELGKRVIPLGSLQLARVTSTSSRAIVTKSFSEIAPGDLLVPYRNLDRREVSLKTASRQLKGMIVESYSGRNAVAAGDVVYLDLGAAHGLEAGNLLYVVREVSVEKMLVDISPEQLPHEVVGAVVVVDTGRLTSTALVIKSIDAVFRKDMVISAPR